MRRLDVQVPMPDGQSPGTLHIPEGEGPWPGVLVFPDAAGARETFRRMGDRLAGLGYVALIPDIYYRAGDWAPFDAATVFTNRKERARLGRLASALTKDRIVADSAAYADFLLARPEVRGPAIGTTGYCLGGRMSLIAAGGLGGQIAAAASFHGGRLAVADDPASPHLSADRITAAVYVAGAQDDDSFSAAQAELLRTALTEAAVSHTVEFYPARHGFAVPDNPTYSPEADARHWEALREFYHAHLGWRAPQVERQEAPPIAGERQMLEAWLEFHRQTLLVKCSGLTAGQLRRRAAPPSSMSLLGLVRHMTDVERAWFRRWLSGEDVAFLNWSNDDPDGDFDHVEEADPEQDIATYLRELELARKAAAVRDLDDTFFHPRRNIDMSLRWVYVHMIEEYARHNGHADLLRERIDGATGE